MSYQQSEFVEKTEEDIRKHLAPWRLVLLEIFDRVSQQRELENNQDAKNLNDG
jgi:hypothetical protein